MSDLTLEDIKKRIDEETENLKELNKSFIIKKEHYI